MKGKEEVLRAFGSGTSLVRGCSPRSSDESQRPSPLEQAGAEVLTVDESLRNCSIETDGYQRIKVVPSHERIPELVS